jgi:hypothetical protein
MDTIHSTNKTKAICLLAAVALIGASLLAGGFGATYAQDEPIPYFRAFPDGNAVDGGNWPLGAKVHLAIDDPTTKAAPDYKQKATVIVAPWDEASTYVRFDFDNAYDLKRGDVVRLSADGIVRELVVPFLWVTTVDVETDIVGGTAEPGTLVHVFIGGDAELFVTADSERAWVADFGGIGFDLLPGMGGGAEVWFDDFGDSTIFDWSAPPPPPLPWLTAFPEWEYIEAVDWPVGLLVHLAIDDPNTPDVPDYQADTTTMIPDWESDPERGWALFPLVNYDLKAGDLVVMTGGGTTIEHVVRNLTITGVDMGAETVAGTADPGVQLQVWAHQQSVPPVNVVAGEDGTWLADLTGVYDIVPSTAGRAWIIAEGGNATAVDWSAPPPPPTPWLIAFPENDAVEGWEWPEGVTVTLTINNAPPGFEREGIAAVTTWGDPRTYVRFDFADAYDLKVGDIVTLTDGMTVRQHTVKTLFVTDVDADKDEISGKAGGDETVYVWPHEAWFEPLQITTHSITGNWQVDFTDVPFDLAPGMSGRSQILDETGNATAVDWYAHPRYTGHWRAVDSYDHSNMQLTISGGGNNQYELTWTDDYWSACGGRGIGLGTGILNTGGSLRVNWVIKCQRVVVWEGQVDYFLDIITGTLWDGANTWYLVSGK